MLGWEYPPKISGGLGIASQGLAHAIAQKHKVHFLVPTHDEPIPKSKVRVWAASNLNYEADYWENHQSVKNNIEIQAISARLMPYLTPDFFSHTSARPALSPSIQKKPFASFIDQLPLSGQYTDSLSLELGKYTLLAAQYAAKFKFDLIHAHDWMTLSAAAVIKELYSVPFIAHIHSTENERNGIQPNPEIKELEKRGLQNANRIIAVSSQTKKIIIDEYGITPEKIWVIPNGNSPKVSVEKKINSIKKIGFIGRLTHQKGPAIFLDIAWGLLKKRPDLQFEIIGNGYLESELKSKVHQLNLGNNVKFFGFMGHKETLQKMSELAILIMPSISEPFGLVALEAVQLGIPVIVSKNCGLREFLPELSSFDGWDSYSFVQEAERILKGGNEIKLNQALIKKSAKNLTWKNSSELVDKVYLDLLK